MTLSSEEVERYARQIVLHGVGGPGQTRLKAARVLVVGAGGLGSPALQYLAGAGVGTLGIVDDDVVALSNLHRQILHATGDIGRAKTASASEAIRRLNPHVTVEPIGLRLDAANARGLVAGFDVVLDGSDNFDTRYALSDACYWERRPLVAAALGAFDGTLTMLKPYEIGPDGRPNPTYRCLFPEPPEPGVVPTCAEAGVLGAICGVLGSLMALEAIREIVGGFGDGDQNLVGRLLMVDVKAMRFETLRYGWDESQSAERGRAKRGKRGGAFFARTGVAPRRGGVGGRIKAEVDGARQIPLNGAALSGTSTAGGLKRSCCSARAARGDARPDSDYDVAIFLDTVSDRWAELDRLADLRVSFLDETGAFFDAKPYPVTAYGDDTPLMYEIRREGVTV